MPGASSWLSVLPLAEFGFALNKGEFRDALSLRYGRPLKGLLAMCICGQKYPWHMHLTVRKVAL